MNTYLFDSFIDDGPNILTNKPEKRFTNQSSHGDSTYVNTTFKPMRAEDYDYRTDTTVLIAVSATIATPNCEMPNKLSIH